MKYWEELQLIVVNWYLMYILQSEYNYFTTNSRSNNTYWNVSHITMKFSVELQLLDVNWYLLYYIIKRQQLLYN